MKEDDPYQWWNEVESEKERFIDSLMAGKTTEEIDAFEASTDVAAHAAHFCRISKLGNAASPNRIAEEYLRAAAEGGDSMELLEREYAYNEEYGTALADLPVSAPSDTALSSGDYDGRDDELIRIAAEHCACDTAIADKDYGELIRTEAERC